MIQFMHTTISKTRSQQNGLNHQKKFTSWNNEHSFKKNA